MGTAPRRSLVLILAREFSANLATAMFVVDSAGTAVFYNESAERILGVQYADAGPLQLDEWAKKWNPEDADGRPLPPDALPLVRALNERRPAHSSFRITRPDGQKEQISVTAFPLFAKAEEFVGAVAIFWQNGPVPSG